MCFLFFNQYFVMIKMLEYNNMLSKMQKYIMPNHHDLSSRCIFMNIYCLEFCSLFFFFVSTTQPTLTPSPSLHLFPSFFVFIKTLAGLSSGLASFLLHIINILSPLFNSELKQAKGLSLFVCNNQAFSLLSIKIILWALQFYSLFSSNGMVYSCFLVHWSLFLWKFSL